MKTVKDIDILIQSENDKINKELPFLKNDETKVKTAKNRYAKRITFLRQVKGYLESYPKEENIIRDRDKLERIVERRKDNYPVWADANKAIEKPEREFKKLYIKPIMDRIKTLNFILLAMD